MVGTGHPQGVSLHFMKNRKCDVGGGAFTGHPHVWEKDKRKVTGRPQGSPLQYAKAVAKPIEEAGHG